MILNPSKMLASVAFAAVIFVVGSVAIVTGDPKLAITQTLAPLASSESTDQLAEKDSSVDQIDASENAKIDEQISPENATMEVEAMVASIDANYPIDNDDWSLETISDDALELRR